MPLADLNVADPASRYRRVVASGHYFYFVRLLIRPTR